MPMDLWTARGCVRDIKPNCPPTTAENFINGRIARVIDRHRWSDLLRVATITVPDAYTTGTVSLVSGSATINGVGTSWPTNDLVNTTVTNPSPGIIESPSNQKISVASMAGIAVNQPLLLDQENASVTEVVIPYALAADGFYAWCSYNHASGVTVKASSLAGQQFRAGGSAMLTIRAVLSSTQLSTDMPYGGPNESGISYLIYRGLAPISATARRLRFAYDPIAGRPIDVDHTIEWLSIVDPQRTSSGDVAALVQTAPSPAGSMQWEIWPAQTSKYAIVVVYDDGWPTLVNGSDLLPPYMNPWMIVNGARADALRMKVMQNGAKQDPLYDPVVAQEYERQFESDVENAIQMDQGRYMTFLTNYEQVARGGGPGGDYWQSHAPWPTDLG